MTNKNSGSVETVGVCLFCNGDNPLLFAFSVFQGSGGTAPVVIKSI